MNQELPDVQAGFRKGRGTRDQIANIHWIIRKARQFQKNIYFCFIDRSEEHTSELQSLNHQKSKRVPENVYFRFIDCVKAFDCVDHKKLWKIIKGIGIPDYLTCLLRNLYAGQEATVRTRLEIMDWFKIGKII